MQVSNFIKASIFSLSVGLGGCSIYKIQPSELIKSWDEIPTSVTFSCVEEGASGTESGGFIDAKNFAIKPSQFKSARNSVPMEIGKTEAYTALNELFDISTSNSIARKSTGQGGFEASGGIPSAELTVGGNVEEKAEANSLSSKDLKEFTSSIAKSLAKDFVGQLGTVKEGADGVPSTFKLYFSDYANEGFVSRTGSQWKYSENAALFGGDQSGALIAMFIESLSDKGLRTPILYKKKGQEEVFLSSGTGKVPSAVRHEIVEKVEIADRPDVCGITEQEHRLIKSMLAGSSEASKLINSLILEALGDIEVSFVVGADFSIGDAETLPAMVRAFTGTTAHVLQEQVYYEFFYHLAYTTPKSANKVENGAAGPYVFGPNDYTAIGVTFNTNDAFEGSSFSDENVTSRNTIESLLYEISKMEDGI